MIRYVFILFSVLCSIPAYTQIEFQAHVLDSNVIRVSSIHAIDLDNDSDIDILAAEDYNIVWYENLGEQTFTRHSLAANLTNRMSIMGSDLDNDGDMDAISACNENIRWYENDGNENFTSHAVSDTSIGEKAVYPIDINMDGYTDLITARGGRRRGSGDPWFGVAYGEVVIYFNNEDTSFSPDTVSIIDATAIFAIDLDKDGDIDITTSTVFDNSMVWYENKGNGNFTSHTISDLGSACVYSVDLNHSGYMDILGKFYGDIYWYRNKGNMEFEEIIISGPDYLSTGGECCVLAEDMNGDGKIDLIDAGYKIIWYENDGNDNYYPNLIADNAGYDYDYGPETPIYTADIDKDGDKDIISTSEFGNRLTWYENKLYNAGTNLDIRSTKKFSIYPNPTNDHLTIEFILSEEHSIRITSINGQLIHSEEMEGTTHQLDLSSFQKGVYFITIRSEDFITTRKIIKL